MKLSSFSRLKIGSPVWIVAGVLLLPFLTATLLVAQPGPEDFDFDMLTDKADYTAGETVTLTTGIAVRADGVQGWSYGVVHDADLLTLEEATTAGTDTETVFSSGFNGTALIMEDPPGTGVIGFIQPIILSFKKVVIVPQSDFFSMGAATYRVDADACVGAGGNVSTQLEFTEDLAVFGGPTVGFNVTVGGVSILPANVKSADVTIQCDAVEGSVSFQFDQDDNDLSADQTDTLDLEVQLSNATAAAVDVQGWQYGVLLDTDEVEAIEGKPGADSAALNGGQGPDFVSYDLQAAGGNGTLQGVTVGVVIALTGPATEDLLVGANETKHLDTIVLRSVVDIVAPEPERTTPTSFSNELGTPEPVDSIIVVAGLAVEPTITDTKTIRLVPTDTTGPRFIRGDANNDARLNISDGIWILNMLFYGAEQTACMPAADANAEGGVNISDSMYIFNYQLQLGASPGNLNPPPPAPFPGCGTADDATLENCPSGSTTCG
jgi:hypothetical protein